MKKILASLVLTFCLVICCPISSMACNKTSGCYATAVTVTCGTQNTAYSSTHYIIEPNGYSYYCDVANVSSVHAITCSGCGAYLRSESRICRKEHSRCGGTQFGLCQY